jgi:hypothetical protein
MGEYADTAWETNSLQGLSLHAVPGRVQVQLDPTGAILAVVTGSNRWRLWHRARDFDRGSHQPGHHGGSVGHAALQVLHSLIFDFLNHRTGRLDPSYEAIARKAGVCVRTVATAKRLRELGILNWVRRCAESWRDGRFVLEQETNAYAVLPEREPMCGYRPPTEPSAPAPGTWGRTSASPALCGRPGGAGERSEGQGAGAEHRSR